MCVWLSKYSASRKSDAMPFVNAVLRKTAKNCAQNYNFQRNSTISDRHKPRLRGEKSELRASIHTVSAFRTMTFTPSGGHLQPSKWSFPALNVMTSDLVSDDHETKGDIEDLKMPCKMNKRAHKMPTFQGKCYRKWSYSSRDIRIISYFCIVFSQNGSARHSAWALPTLISAHPGALTS